VKLRPKELVKAWVEAFNRAVVTALMDFYSATAVNHQVAQEPVEGIDAIRKMFADEFARTKMICIIESIFEDEEWAILEWQDPQGLRGCGLFHAVNGKIVHQRG
jgi:ketosteroid isomerase-like protein